MDIDTIGKVIPDEVYCLIEDILDTLIVVGNGATCEDLRDRVDDLFKVQDLLHEVDCGNFTVLPCKIGDQVWAIRNHGGVPNVHPGFVSEMFFLEIGGVMRLNVVVKNIARGEWGKKIFPTREEASAAIGRLNDG